MNNPKLQTISCRFHPNSTLIEDYRAGDMICRECGLVVGDRVVDVGPEWRVFADDSGSADRSRVGQVEDALHGEKTLTTRICGDSRKTEEHGSYMRYQNRRMGGVNDATLIKHFKEIAIMSERINLSRNIVMKAQYVFKMVSRSKALRGRASDEIIASCIYIACRQENVPRSFKEICAASKVNKREIGRCFKLIVRNLEMNLESANSDDFISRFCARLDVSNDIVKLAKHITARTVKLDLVPGRSPISLASTAICIAVGIYGKTPTFKEICESTGCSESTIRQLLKLILPRLKDILPAGLSSTNLVENMKG